MSYLKSYLSAIPDGQRDALVKIIEQQKADGLIETRDQFDAELNKLLKVLKGSRDFSLHIDLQRPDMDDAKPVSSSMLNSNFKSIYTALHGLFHQSNQADATATRHREVRNADFARLKAGVNKVLEDILVFTALRYGSGEWNEIRGSNFWDKRNANTSIKSAEVDERTKKLRLRIGRANRMQQLTGSRPTKVSVENMGMGQTDAMSKSVSPEHMLDAKTSTFWAHMVMADHKIQSTVDGTEMAGAVVRVTLEFPNIEPVSCMEFLPFGSHPLQIAQLQYWSGEEWVDMTGWTQPDASLDWEHIGFPEVQTNKIRFLLQQENFTRNTYLVPRRLFTAAILWEMALDQTLLYQISEDELTEHQEASVEANPRYRALLSGLSQFSSRLKKSGLTLDTPPNEEIMDTADAAAIVMSASREGDAEVLLRALTEESSAETLASEDTIEITKYEYLFGLYHVAVEHRDYFPLGLFESPKYDTHGVVYEVAVDATEAHVQKDGVDLTSIEHEIEVAPGRSYPILPYGQTREFERLDVDRGTRNGQLRFTPAGVPNIELRCNGVVTTDYTQTGRTIHIDAGYNSNNIYTIDYDVAANQDILDVDATWNSAEVQRAETFKNTDDNGMIKLSYYPYVAWEIINNTADWAKTDPEHAEYTYRVDAGLVTIDGITYGVGNLRYEPIRVLVDGIRARNITDYREGVHPAFVESPSQELIYQYLHAGRHIYFNRPVKNATISVTYRWMTQYVRLVSTLRGHRPVVNPYTPVLEDYKVRMKTSRL